MTSTESPKPNLSQRLVHVALWLCHPVIACFELPMRGGKTDLQMAIYLWHNDPNHDRGRTTAICYAANAGQKIAIISLAPIFLIAGLVWLLGMNALPMNTLANSVIAALAACGTAFVGTAILWLDRLGRSHGMG